MRLEELHVGQPKKIGDEIIRINTDARPLARQIGTPGGRTGAGDREPDAVTDKTTLERRLDRVLARATRPRGAAVVIATVSTSITVAAGILMTVADHNTFPSVGSGLWWAVQTVTTVGYGDHVPAT